MTRFNVLLFVTFIQQNPGFAAWLIGGLVTCVAALVATYYALIYQRIGHLESRVELVEKDTAGIKEELKEYAEHVGAGDRALDALSRRIEKHMTEEEVRVWSGVAAIRDKLSEIQVENVEAHAEIVTKHGDRLTRIESQLVPIQKAMSNGEIGEILVMLRKLTAGVKA